MTVSSIKWKAKIQSKSGSFMVFLAAFYLPNSVVFSFLVGKFVSSKFVPILLDISCSKFILKYYTV